ncbi:hypothetical protein ACU4GH_11110 [Bradyrhizobium betae]
MLGIWLLINVLFVVIMLPPRTPDRHGTGTLAPVQNRPERLSVRGAGEVPASPCRHLDRLGGILLAGTTLDGSN